MTHPPELVLDTNVVLDWLAFSHPIARPLADALEARRWRWVATRAMRDELAHVIGRQALARWAIEPETIWSAWERHAGEHEPPGPLGVHERLVCTDPDDQKFIDLAVSRRAAALLTRDRAVLKLAARARRFDLLIATPERWLAMASPAMPADEAQPEASRWGERISASQAMKTSTRFGRL